MTHLVALVQRLGITSESLSLIDRFTTLFVRWNERINLSAASTRSEVEDHIRDSLHVVPHLDGTRIIDVGAGGGFPVVIAAICRPAIHFVALEPVHKKHAFLRTVARELALVNLEARAERVEDHHVRDYDDATSRATFDLRDWLATGLELVRPGGVVLGFEAVPRADLPADIERHQYDLDGKQRSIVMLRKPRG